MRTLLENLAVGERSHSSDAVRAVRSDRANVRLTQPTFTATSSPGNDGSVRSGHGWNGTHGDRYAGGA